MNLSVNNEKGVNEIARTRTLGYQVAKVLTDQELLAVSGALAACQAGQKTTWATGPDGYVFANDCY